MLAQLQRNLAANFSHWNYRKNQLLRTRSLQAILRTRPIPSDENAPADLFVLTSGEDLYPLLIAIKSLCFWARQRFRVNIACDDGMLKPHHVRVIQGFIPGANLITDRPAILRQIAAYPTITRFHLDAKDPSYPKLSIPALYARKDKVIVMDTDVIFFREPKLLAQWVRDPADRTDYHRDPSPLNKPFPFPKLEEEVRATFKVGPPPPLESGLLLFHKDLLALDKLEAVSALFEKHGYTQWTKELEIYNVLFRLRGQSAPLPLPDYGGVYDYGAAAVHYFSKHMYIRPSILHMRSLIEFMTFMEGHDWYQGP